MPGKLTNRPKLRPEAPASTQRPVNAAPQPQSPEALGGGRQLLGPPQEISVVQGEANGSPARPRSAGRTGGGCREWPANPRPGGAWVVGIQQPQKEPLTILDFRPKKVSLSPSFPNRL
uniref:Uncharacterized protein n=1 Tax=Sphaerodactylus townsendi TaxID=933632 RepID=A0ACB8EFC5_9SAUR